MSAKNKKAPRETRSARGRKVGVGKPRGFCSTWFNQSGALFRGFNALRAAILVNRQQDEIQAQAVAA